VVDLGVMRQGERELLWFKVERDKIPVYSIDASYMAAPEIGYIRLSRFAQTTPEEFDKAMGKLDEQGMKHLIVDLQDNGGGYLNSAVELADFFLPSSELVVYTEGRSDGKRNYLTRHLFDHFKGRVVVLINEQSASASEILAGCLQDLDRGVIVGRRSFGKGLVQSPVRMPNGGMIRLTISHYYTPSGRCIQKPYTKGDQKSYNEDLLNRFKQGELQSADSIDFADSLKCYTRNGRVVYGGGGIMPDIFVPLDTTRYTRLHRELSARSYVVNASLHYMDQNRKHLLKQYKTFDDFRKQFTIPDYVLDEMLAEAEKKDSLRAKDDEELQKARTDVALTLKGLVARDLWDMSEYFQIIYADDPVVQKALEVLHKK
jgi:carboxyl-terminal processing protease